MIFNSIFTSFIALTLAIYADEANVLEWHQKYIRQPLHISTIGDCLFIQGITSIGCVSIENSSTIWRQKIGKSMVSSVVYDGFVHVDTDGGSAILSLDVGSVLHVFDRVCDRAMLDTKGNWSCQGERPFESYQSSCELPGAKRTILLPNGNVIVWREGDVFEKLVSCESSVVIWTRIEALGDVESFDHVDDPQDKYGNRKALLFLSKTGIFVSIDSLSGEIIWYKNRIQGMYVQDNLVNLLCDHEIITSSPFTGIVSSSEPSDSDKVIKQGNNLLFVSGEQFVSQVYVYRVFEDGIRGYHKTNSVMNWFVPVNSLQLIVHRDISMVTASMGNILDDRSVLYRFLYPNLLLFVDSIDGLFHVKVIDSVTATMIYHSRLSKGVLGPFHAVFHDYGFVLDYYSPISKRSEVLVVDLFESCVPDERILTTSPYNISIPCYKEAVHALAFHPKTVSITKTLNGISSRHILWLSVQGELFSVAKPKYDQTELATTPLNIISHSHQLDIRKITCIPTLMESTTSVVGYDGDLFVMRYTSAKLPFDRLAPGFSKELLVAVMCGFTIAWWLANESVKKSNEKRYWE